MNKLYFNNANFARAVARNIPLILEEVNAIEESVAYSSKNGFFETIVDNTFMTSVFSSAAPEYYQSWKNNLNDEKTDQMNQVIKYFTDNGFFINRIENTSSLTTFKWVVRW